MPRWLYGYQKSAWLFSRPAIHHSAMTLCLLFYAGLMKRLPFCFCDPCKCGGVSFCEREKSKRYSIFLYPAGAWILCLMFFAPGNEERAAQYSENTIGPVPCLLHPFIHSALYPVGFPGLHCGYILHCFCHC